VQKVNDCPKERCPNVSPIEQKLPHTRQWVDMKTTLRTFRGKSEFAWSSPNPYVRLCGPETIRTTGILGWPQSAACRPRPPRKSNIKLCDAVEASIFGQSVREQETSHQIVRMSCSNETSKYYSSRWMWRSWPRTTRVSFLFSFPIAGTIHRSWQAQADTVLITLFFSFTGPAVSSKKTGNHNRDLDRVLQEDF